MTELRAVFLCVAGALVCAVLKGPKPEFRLAAAMAAGLAAAAMSMDGIRTGVTALQGLSSAAGMDGGTGSTLLRATGVAMIAEFGAQLCRDAGESALAGRVELAGRAALIGMTVPLLTGFTGRLMSILP